MALLAAFTIVSRRMGFTLGRNTLVSASGYSAYQLVFGSNSMDLYGWDDTDEDLLFARDTSISGQFVQQWQLRIRA